MANEKEAPKKPGPVNLENIKPPEAPPAAPAPPGPPSGNVSQFPGAPAGGPDNLPHKVEIKLTGNENIIFDVPGGQQAAQFIDSIITMVQRKEPVARLGIGPDLYAIPTERILYAKLARPNMAPQGAR